MHVIDRLVNEVDRAADEIVQFTCDLVRIPTVNLPGVDYESCARFLGEKLARQHFDVEYVVADTSAAHSARYSRVNVIGTRRGLRRGAGVHLNGHIDVVPPAEALRRTGVELPGLLEISEESGGFARVANPATVGRIAKTRSMPVFGVSAIDGMTEVHTGSRIPLGVRE